MSRPWFTAHDGHVQGQAPLRQDKEDFFTRRIYYRVHVRLAHTARLFCTCLCTLARNLVVCALQCDVTPVQDAFNKPVASAPDAYIQVLERNPPDGQK